MDDFHLFLLIYLNEKIFKNIEIKISINQDIVILKLIVSLNYFSNDLFKKILIYLQIHFIYRLNNMCSCEIYNTCTIKQY